MDSASLKSILDRALAAEYGVYIRCTNVTSLMGKLTVYRRSSGNPEYSRLKICATADPDVCMLVHTSAELEE